MSVVSGQEVDRTIIKDTRQDEVIMVSRHSAQGQRHHVHTIDTSEPIDCYELPTTHTAQV